MELSKRTIFEILNNTDDLQIEGVTLNDKEDEFQVTICRGYKHKNKPLLTFRLSGGGTIENAKASGEILRFIAKAGFGKLPIRKSAKGMDGKGEVVGPSEMLSPNFVARVLMDISGRERISAQELVRLCGKKG